MSSSESVDAMLASFAARLEYEDLTPDALVHVKNLVVDALGCALTGERSPELPLVEEAASATFGPGASSIIGRVAPTSAAAATMINAYLVTAMTVCDVYRPAHCHVTPLTVPPALAVGERLRSSGRDFLTAVAAGMETIVRLGLGLNYPEFRRRGWHSPGVIGPLGAAATAGRLLGFDEEQMLRAFGLAATQAGGSYQSWGTPAVKFHQARGAVSGLLAAQMAHSGFLGGTAPLTAADGGMFNTHSDGGDPEAVVADLGTRFELEQVALRLWPGASPVQAMLSGLLDIIRSEGADAETVAEVEIVVSEEDFATHGGFAHPSGTFEALLSYRFLTSVVLHDGRMWFDQVTNDRCRDARILRFGDERVSVTSRADIPLNGCELTVHLRDGRVSTRRVDVGRGAPENPAAPDEVREKFLRCTEPTHGPQRSAELFDFVAHIESLDDVTDLARELTSADSA